MSEWNRYRLTKAAWSALDTLGSVGLIIAFYHHVEWLFVASTLAIVIGVSEWASTVTEWRYRHIKKYLEQEGKIPKT